MGDIYYYGLGGCKKNKGLAVQHWYKAIQNDQYNNWECDRRAVWRLGEMYYWGEGVKKDRDACINFWWQWSADQGYMCANCYLGIDYYQGSHCVEINQEKALGLLEKAVEQGYPPALEYVKNNKISFDIKFQQKQYQEYEEV